MAVGFRFIEREFRWPSPLNVNPIPPPITPLPFHQTIPSSIDYTVPTLKGGNASLAPLGLRVDMGGGDHLHSNSSHTLFPLKNAYMHTKN
ncbi:hypothetical protein EVAR_81401_1 [Eumeta japonica]|uniref:Uncharacterized protein n=1 Tax=Eumeta variegata TaxID=151549 RepID=A0A4C1WF66_EUMVA|nr:hypothetical protein EVAR_81401_1 [Eumeta japonica]